MTEAAPQLWPCIGLIGGVYGISYVIAAFEPMRHWPIVLMPPIGSTSSIWPNRQQFTRCRHD